MLESTQTCVCGLMLVVREPVHIVENKYMIRGEKRVLCDLLKLVNPQEVLWRLMMTVHPPFLAPAPATTAAPSPMSQYTSTEACMEYRGIG